MNIEKLLEKASSIKIAVIGDLIKDTYIFGDVDRVSPEAPVPVLRRTETKSEMGGAGNVFMNLIGLGVDADLYCNYQGQPFWPVEVNDKIFTHDFPHAIKTRIMSGQHHMLRIDQELTDAQMEWLPFKAFSWWERLQVNFGQYHCIVMPDYHKGVLSDSLINAITELALYYKIPIIVDAKKGFGRFGGATILKCNENEYKSMERCSRMGHSTSSALIALNIQYFVVTQGDRGICLFDQEAKYGMGLSAHKINLVDVCGAGDTVTAVLAFMMIAGMMYGDKLHPIAEAVRIANIAASEVCQHSGVYAITKEDLIRRINDIKHTNDSTSFRPAPGSR